MDKMRKVVVFLPCFNEEAGLLDVISSIHSKYPPEEAENRGYHIEVLVVNDGSTDRTEEIAESANVSIISNPRNIGAGSASRIGMDVALDMGADLCVQFKPSLEYKVADIERVLEPLLSGHADVVFASRYTSLADSSITFRNRLISRILTSLTNYNISDSETGLMAFSAKYLHIFDLWGNHITSQQIVIDANFKFMRMVEVPVEFEVKISRHREKRSLYILLNLLWVLINSNPLQVFSGLGVILILFSVCHFLLALYAKAHAWDFGYLFIHNLSIASLLIGVQAFAFGFLADLIERRK